MKRGVMLFLISLLSALIYGQEAPLDRVLGCSLHSGIFNVNGDVNGKGLGYGINFQAPVGTIFSIRMNFFSATAYGLSSQPWFHSSVDMDNIGGGLVENIYSPYVNNTQGWFPSYKFKINSTEYEGIVSILKIVNKFIEFDIPYLDFYTFGSLGLYQKNTYLDLLDRNGKPYLNLIKNSGFTIEKYDTRAGRTEIRNALTKIYDGKYESEIMYSTKNWFYAGGLGIAFQLFDKLDLGAEYKRIVYPDFDYADGLRFTNSTSYSPDDDISSYLSLFLRFKL